MRKIITVLSVLILLLSITATCIGIFSTGEGSQLPYTTLFGETVTLHGTGLYQHDTVGVASQEIAQDWVTLVLGIPLLITGIVLNWKGKVLGKIILTDVLGYFLYTYTSMSFLSSYNPLFLVYVALFSMSLFAFILSLMELKSVQIQQYFDQTFPRKTIIVYLFGLALFLFMAWMGLILRGLVSQTAPVGLESYTTLTIQAMDLGLIVPASILTAVLLIRKQPWGYTLISVLLVKGILMGAALVAMVANQIRMGVEVDPVQSTIFCVIPVVCVWISVRTLKSFKEGSQNA